MMVPHFKSAALTGVRHGFFSRLGGVSSGPMYSLNAYPRHRETGQQVDALDNVAENRRRILKTLDIVADDVVTANQVHGDKILKVDRQEPMDFAEADGLIVDQPNIPVGVLTADCVPIIYTDFERRVAAIVHAGWKGAYLNIHIKMLQELEKLGVAPEQVVAAIGPSAQQISYEVDQKFYTQWLDKGQQYQKYFTDSVVPGKYHFDVPQIIFDDLQYAGVSNVDWVRLDTISNEGMFFSHRRATQRQEAYAGRQISVVCL